MLCLPFEMETRRRGPVEEPVLCPLPVSRSLGTSQAGKTGFPGDDPQATHALSPHTHSVLTHTPNTHTVCHFSVRESLRFKRRLSCF